jgi:dGTPase
VTDPRYRRLSGSSPGTAGRPPDSRTPSQHDRDRILYTDELRRLAGVTQVVGAVEGHIFHNRLTHTFEVAQIARRIAERLVRDQRELADAAGGIDPDVVEAAALAHDLGHPPFGHAAEEELKELAGNADGFEGNPQSFRIVTRLAAHRESYVGLDLTRATLNAILKYPWFRDDGPPEKANKWGRTRLRRLSLNSRATAGATLRINALRRRSWITRTLSRTAFTTSTTSTVQA